MEKNPPPLEKIKLLLFPLFQTSSNAAAPVATFTGWCCRSGPSSWWCRTRISETYICRSLAKRCRSARMEPVGRFWRLSETYRSLAKRCRSIHMVGRLGRFWKLSETQKIRRNLAKSFSAAILASGQKTHRTIKLNQQWFNTKLMQAIVYERFPIVINAEPRRLDWSHRCSRSNPHCSPWVASQGWGQRIKPGWDSGFPPHTFPRLGLPSWVALLQRRHLYQM